MNEKKVIRIDLKGLGLSCAEKKQFEQDAFERFHSLGQYFFEMDEAQVDELLGERAYSGGDLPDSVIDEVIRYGESNESGPSFYFYERDGNLFIEHLQRLKPGVGFSSHIVPKEDWNKSWRKSFSPITISNNLKVVPEWEKSADCEREIYIYPGMGFGTGNHETTYLCLKTFDDLKDKIAKRGECLDFGCGSGILGIGAIKLKKMRVDFVDIDVDALDNCLQNLKVNDYANYRDGHGLILRNRFEPHQYDIVFANILENILLEEAMNLIACLKPAGFLILSGLLCHQKLNIMQKYKSLNFLGEKEKGDWCVLYFRKNE